MARMAKAPVWCPKNLIGTPLQTIKIKKWANGQTNSGNKKNSAPHRPVAGAPKVVTLLLKGEPTCPRVW